MNLRSIITILPAVIISASAISSAIAQEQQTKKGSLTYLPLSTSDNQTLLLAKGTTNGQPLNYLIDTGCNSPLVYDSTFAKKLGVNLKQGRTAKTGSGVHTAQKAIFKDIKVGKSINIASRECDVLKLPASSHLKKDGKAIRFDALVGAPTLASINAIVDYRKNRLLLPINGAGKNYYLNLVKSNNIAFTPLSKTRDHSLYVILKIKQQNFAFKLDTGAEVNTIEPSVAKLLKLNMVDSNSKASGAGGKSKKTSRKTRVDEIKFGGLINIQNIGFLELQAHSGSAKLEDGTIVGGIIGSHVLRSLNAQIDFGSNSLILAGHKTK